MKECPTCKRCFEDSQEKCSHDQNDLLFSQPGTTVIDGKYRLISCLGRGGMGSVYRAEHIHLGRPFAVKTVLPDFASRDPTAIDRFRQEARASAAIHHINVVGVTDFGVTDQRVFYLVMEYVEGRGLQEIINTEGPLTPERVLKIMKQVCAGVGAAHRLNMIHRDLKPSNIMISRPVTGPVSLEEMGLILGDDVTGTNTPAPPAAETEPIIKVLDFGLAKILNTEVLGDGPATLGTGVMGTPHYMSPEQCNGKAVDPRSDVYSLGVVLFQMLTKDVPFKGDSFGAIVSGHLMKNPPSLRALNPVVTEALESVVLRAMSKDPANRQQSVMQLADELEAAISKTSLTASASQAAVLFITTQPGGCDVYIGNDFRGKTGPTGKLALRLDPGEYRLRFTCPGWFDNSRTVAMGSTEQQLEVTLTHKSAGQSAPMQSGAYPMPAQFANSAPNFSSTARMRPTGAMQSPFATPTRPIQAPAVSPTEFPVVKDKYAGLGVDIFLASVCVALSGVLYFAVEPFPDPLSQHLAVSTPFISTLVGFGGIGSTIAAIVAMLMADYQYSHQSTPGLAWVFGISRVGFAIFIVLGTIVAAIGAVINKWDLPPILWFSLRIGLIALFSTLYARVRSRHRAAIV
ncbi:MAG: protein kinase [Blastocatellia bacterium]|nr:protein kinase [Blastocatellia bacterium]